MTHASDHSNTLLRASTALALLALTLLLSSAAAAQSGSELDRVRTGTRYNLGLGMVTGTLDFRSNPVIVITDLGQIPSASLGMEAWLDENAGFQTSYLFGALGEVAVPLNVVAGNEAKIGYVHHRFDGAFLYRWFTGPRLTSMAFGAKLGFVLHNITPQPHSPTLILSTTYFGPTLGATARIPITEGIGIEGEGSLVIPFNVREFPDDSGRPKDPLGFRAGGAPYLRLTETLYLKARYDMHYFNVGFRGTGTRGLGGVTGGASDDVFHSAMLQLEWIP